MPSKATTERATSSAACGGQIDRITSLRSANSVAVPASSKTAARAEVSALRPSEAQSTCRPAPRKASPTAEPISPGWSSPITIALEEKLAPRRPPVVGARNDRPRVDDLDAGAVAELRDRVGPLVLDLDLAGLAGVVRRHGIQVPERLFGAGLDCLTRARGHEAACALDARALLDLHRRQAVAEQFRSLTARRLVAGDHQHRAAPGATERRVDPGLADERAVEPEVLEVRAGDGVVHHAVRGPRPRVHADEQRRVDAPLQELGVLGPFVLDDELAVRVEVLGDQRVERVAVAGAVAVHHHDLGSAPGLGAPHGGVDLLGVEPAALLIERRVALRARLLALDDPGAALDVAD